jgi:hypothetical protein
MKERTQLKGFEEWLKDAQQCLDRKWSLKKLYYGASS